MVFEIPDRIPRWADEEEDDDTRNPMDLRNLAPRLEASIASERSATANAPAQAPTFASLTMRTRPALSDPYRSGFSDRWSEDYVWPGVGPEPGKNQITTASQAERPASDGSGDESSTQRAAKSPKLSFQKRRRRHGKKRKADQEDETTAAATSYETSSAGVPLLPSSEATASSSRLVPELWNAFAENISPTATPQALALFQMMNGGKLRRRTQQLLLRGRRIWASEASNLVPQLRQE
jgi:hypothetical protein